MKLLLIQANDTRLRDGSSWAEQNRRYAYAPTTLTTLAGLVPPELNADIEIVDEGVQVLRENFEADIVGISAATPNAPRAYKIARHARERGITVVLGGCHPTLMANEALEHADSVVKGYAERSWPRLLMDYQAGKMQRLYSDPVLDVFRGSMPLPRRDLLKPGAYMLRNSLEATRGCSNQCAFCVVPATSQKRLACRRVSDVIREIRSMKTRKVVFLDSNPFGDAAYMSELCKALIPLEITWYGSAAVDTLKNATLLRLAATSGCRGLLIGFESLNEGSLSGSNKRFNRPGKYLEIVRTCHNHGIAVLGCFIFGFDGDDEHIFERTVKFVDEARIDLVQYSILTPFPGTPLFKALAENNRIITRDWSLYDGKNVVFKPSLMAEDVLREGFRCAWKETYSLSSIMKRVLGSRSEVLLSLMSNLGFRYFYKKFFPNDSSQNTLNRVSETAENGTDRRIR